MTGLWWLIPVKLIADVTDLGFMVRLWVALFIVRLLSVIPNKMYEAFFVSVVILTRFKSSLAHSSSKGKSGVIRNS